MKHLHQAINTRNRVFWFGQLYPCLDEYHRNYEHERIQTADHHECMRTICRQMGVEQSDRYYCNCIDCMVPEMAHYSYRTYSDPDPDPWHNTGPTPICEPCRSSNHPTPQPRPI